MPDKRDAYVQKLKAKIDEWNAEIDKLAAKADLAEASSRAQYRKQVENLREKRAELQRKIDNLRQAGEGAWEELKIGVDSAWKALGEAVKSAVSKFK